MLLRPLATALAATLLLAAAGCSIGGRQRGLYDGQDLPKTARVDRIIVHKSDNILEAWQGKRLLKVYRAMVGSGGSGPKRYDRDKRTPEGTYRVTKRAHSRTYHRFLGISYPNAADRAAFKAARERGAIPKSAAIGGGIGIHGVKNGFGWAPNKWFNWTKGGIAVTDAEVEELFRAVAPGAVVVIRH